MGECEGWEGWIVMWVPLDIENSGQLGADLHPTLSTCVWDSNCVLAGDGLNAQQLADSVSRRFIAVPRTATLSAEIRMKCADRELTQHSTPLSETAVRRHQTRPCAEADIEDQDHQDEHFEMPRPQAQGARCPLHRAKT